MTTAGMVYPVTADDPHLIAERLDAAEELLRARALAEENHGILVTRHRSNSFTVSLSPDVPYGTTRECDLA